MSASGEYCFVVKWSGKEYSILGLGPNDSIGILKDRICKETGVFPSRQKLLGLKLKGKVPSDGNCLHELNLSATTKIIMMGSKEEEIESVAVPEDAPDVVDDFDIGDEEEVPIENREEYLAKIERRIRDYKIGVLSEPRDGKKLLVLDIDYTLFDHRSVAEKGSELMRPYLHDFLSTAYQHYDIAIWSATSMKWIEVKMKELGVSSNTNYKICFHLCSMAMITVHTQKYGVIEVKPLGVIWGKFPQWTAKNTIMFDDIRRNFLMNPQTGLKIRPFKKAHLNRDKDQELLYLSRYLMDIARLDDFTSLNHNAWERYRPNKKPREEPL